MKRISVLVGHFFLRLTQNDSLAQEDRRRENMIFYLAFLVSFGAYFAHKLFFPYLLFSALTGWSNKTIWLEKTYFITMTMALVGIVSVMSWDNLFLDRKDFGNLFFLPIPRVQIYFAKFLSLTLFTAMVSTAVNIMAIIIINLYTADKVGGNLFMQTGGLFFSNFLAHLLVFLFVAMVQVLLMIAFKGDVHRKFAGWTQNLLLTVFVSTFAWFPVIYPKLEALKNSDSIFFRFFPPLWFTGFSETLIGNNDPFFTRHFWTVLWALAILVVIYVSAIPLSISRFKILAENGGTGRGRLQKKKNSLTRLFQSRYPASQLQKGIFHFVIHSVKRGRRHKFILASFILLPMGLVAAELVVMISKKGVSILNHPDSFINSIPVLLLFFMVLGLRLGVRHPIHYEANWIFKSLPLPEYKHIFRGMKKAMTVAFVLPFGLILGVVYTYFWGFARAFLHLGFSLTLALILLELFFLWYKKIPFTYEHSPEPMGYKLIWMISSLGFLAFLAILTEVAGVLIVNPSYYFIYFPLIALVLAALKFYRYRVEDRLEFHYEEIQVPVFLSLDQYGL